MRLGAWIKKKMASLALAMANVEKDMLSQGGGIGESTNQHRRHRQGSLADDLKQGQVTQQVKELRWRMYKVLEVSKKHKTKVVGYDEDGFMLTETVESKDGSTLLSKAKLDGHDDYPLELIVNNDEITLSVSEAMFGVDGVGKINKDLDDDGNPRATIGEVGGEDNESSNKSVRVIMCNRELRTKFEIEKYAKKMNVRTISDTKKLLEFYVSIYPDEYNRKSRFFISEIKKAIKNPRVCDFLNINGVEFISYNTVGSEDMLNFEYKITGFDKIVEFDGYYVVKFKSEVIKNGESIYEKYREKDLDERYKNKEPKNK
jgi:hypothetical protein